MRWMTVLFAVSGFSGLIYESIWTHYLKLLLGHAAYAQTLVLAIFMGGLAIGSWAATRLLPRLADCLRAYALAEAVVGLAAIAFHPFFLWMSGQYMFGAVAGAPEALRWGLAALVILPQSVLLGATFPLMAAGLAAVYPGRDGRIVAQLYFANSLGAVVGVLASGFVLIPSLGLDGTMRFAGAVNLGLAACVFLLAPRSSRTGDPVRMAEMPSSALGYLAVAALTGASSFVYEVVWLRMLALVLGASTHAFELMLAAFILGLALGALWIRKRIEGFAAPLLVLAGAQFAMGILALATLPLYNASFAAMQWMIGALPASDAGYVAFNIGSNLIAMAVMLPASICAGTTLPLLTRLLSRAGGGQRAVGQVYAANTLGAIAGVMFAIHLGLPLLGLKNSLAVAAGIDGALGLLLLWRAAPPRRGIVAGAGALLAAVLVVAVEPDARAMASGVFRTGEMLGAREQLIAAVDGKTATIAVTGLPERFIALRTNGKVDIALEVSGRTEAFSSGDAVSMMVAGALGAVFNPDARRAAVVGFGSGRTSHVMLLKERFTSVETFEIEPAMVTMAGHFRRINGLAFDDPRSRVRIDDARTLLAADRDGFDVLVSMPSHPWVSGVASLFSREFYGLAASRLRPQGVFVQWLQAYEITPDLVLSALKAVNAEFKAWRIYAADGASLMVVAANDEAAFRLDPDALQGRLLDDLRRAGIAGIDDLTSRFLADRRMLRPLIDDPGIAMHTDFQPVLDYAAVRTRFLKATAEGVFATLHSTLPVREMLAAPEAAVASPNARLTPLTLARHPARLVRDYLLEGAAPVARDGQPAPVRAASAAVRAQLIACSQGSRDGLAQVGMMVGGVLSKEDSAAVWDRLGQSPCGPGNEDLIALFRGIGQHDGRAMVEAANALGRKDQALGRYAALAAGLGAAASGAKGQTAALAEIARTDNLADQFLARLLIGWAQ